MLRIFSVLFRLFRKIERNANLMSAKKAGLQIGSRTLLVGSQSFGSEPFLIQIGQNCLITDGVKFITHDGAIQVPLIASGENFDDVYSKKSTFGRIAIGNNVFIGVGAIILPDTVIGNNSIVAAGSVVKGEFPCAVVLAGNPAKIICSTDDYHARNKMRIFEFQSSPSRKEQILNNIN